VQEFLSNPQLKELESVFSYVLTDLDCLCSEGVVIKDLSHLLEGRTKDEIIVVDCGDHQVDDDVTSFNFNTKYDGADYVNIKELKKAIKAVI
jgi:hypothetical protein